jgi:hypothetical protein
VEDWDLTYYAVTAQVLPTLLIAFVIGMRNLRFPRSWFTVWLAFQGVLVLSATAGAVWAIRHGGGTKFVDNVIFASYAFLLPGFASLILRWFAHPDEVHSGRAFLQLTAPPMPPTPPTSPRPERRRSKPTLLVIGIAALLGAAVGRRRT